LGQGAEAQANHLRLNIARVLIDSGRLDEAMETLPACLDRATRLHRSHDVVTGLIVMARYYRLTGEVGRAWSLVQIALPRAISLANENSEIYLAIEAALDMVEQGRHRDAVPLLSSLTKQDLAVGDRLELEAALALCKAALARCDFDRGWAEGIARRIGDCLPPLLEIPSAPSRA
jgi:thioredoxin-like negative regulator of GroEL